MTIQSLKFSLKICSITLLLAIFTFIYAEESKASSIASVGYMYCEDPRKNFHTSGSYRFYEHYAFPVKYCEYLHYYKSLNI